MTGALLMMIPRFAHASSATPDEMAEAHRFVTASFAAANPRPPFSFIYDGRPCSELLHSWQPKRAARKLDAQRTARSLTYSDPRTGLVVSCDVIEYRSFPAVEWLLRCHNAGSRSTPIIEHIEPLDLELAASSQDRFTLHHSLGDSNSADSFAPVDQPLAPGGRITLAPNGGRSSDGHLPFFNLQRRGGGTVIAIGWSGQWQADFRRGARAVQAECGMELTHLRLDPGETIRTPRILLLFWKGGEALRGNNVFRQLLLDHYLPRRDGELVLPPICASIAEADPDGSYEGPHTRVMPVLAARGIEVFWSDMDPQQWYPKGFPEGTGTWEPDPVKYPRGLKPIGDAAHAAGLGYLLWFEPERVQPATRIDREHPEWVMKLDGESSQLFRLHDPQARKWLTDYIDVQISAARLDWIRWDFNLEPLRFWRRNDAPDRQGMTEIQHIEGLYAMWDELRARHPGLIVDLCASGGRRIDLEALMRGLPLWHSDLQCSGPHPAADQLQNGGLNRWLPLHGCGDFDYEPSYAFRSAMTAGNILCANTSAPDTAEAVKRTVAAYSKVRPYMLGDFYPLFPHRASEQVWYGYQFHRPDLDAGIALLFRREKCHQALAHVRLKGIDPQADYKTSFQDREHTKIERGRRLAALRVEVPSAPGSLLLCYQKVKRGV
jgi:alpha-galactosidase